MLLAQQRLVNFGESLLSFLQPSKSARWGCPVQKILSKQLSTWILSPKPTLGFRNYSKKVWMWVTFNFHRIFSCLHSLELLLAWRYRESMSYGRRRQSALVGHLDVVQFNWPWNWMTRISEMVPKSLFCWKLVGILCTKEMTANFELKKMMTGCPSAVLRGSKRWQYDFPVLCRVQASVWSLFRTWEAWSFSSRLDILELRIECYLAFYTCMVFWGIILDPCLHNFWFQ